MKRLYFLTDHNLILALIVCFIPSKYFLSIFLITGRDGATATLLGISALLALAREPQSDVSGFNLLAINN